MPAVAYIYELGASTMKLLRYIVICMLFSLLSCEGIKKSSMTKNEVPGISIGPEKGYLVLSGGGIGWEADTAISVKPPIEKFIELIGNKEGKVVVIPTAAVDDDLDERYYTNIKKALIGAGVKKVEILHTRDTAVANSPTFLSKIRDADGLWFPGGKPYRLSDAYLNTKVIDEMNDLLNRGGVIGGNSAGLALLGSYFVKYDDTGKIQTVGSYNNRGFNLFKNAIIIPHFLSENRQFDLFELDLIDKYPSLIVFGVDDLAAIVVHNNQLEVIGNGYVAVYDGTFQKESKQLIKLPKNSERFYLLPSGSKYDLINRIVIQPK